MNLGGSRLLYLEDGLLEVVVSLFGGEVGAAGGV